MTGHERTRILLVEPSLDPIQTSPPCDIPNDDVDNKAQSVNPQEKPHDPARRSGAGYAAQQPAQVLLTSFGASFGPPTARPNR